MKNRKFTVILLPDQGIYQVFFPHYPTCFTWGETVEEALAKAKEALELHLDGIAESDGDPVEDYVHPSHVVIGEVEAAVPDKLLEPVKTKAKASSR